MNPLRTIARDLVERKLWPVAALLAAVLVAVPVLFLRPAPAALEGATPPAPVAAAAAAPAAPAGATPADPTTDPNVAMTSSPFSAAFGAGTSLPPSMEGLLKSTKGPDKTSEVADSPLKDPFAPAVAPATQATATTGSAAPRATSASGASSDAPAASAGAGAGALVPETTPAAASPSTPAPEITPAAVKPAGGDSTADPTSTVFHADVSFGTTETAPLMSDVQRLTAFPSAISPVAVFLGIMRGGWGAVFALRDGTQPIGAPSCRPRKQICTWVILHQGETVTLNVKDDVTGAVTPYQLKLERLSRTTLSSEAAKLANGRASADGRCLLGPLAAYRYDTESGTLAARPELKSCRYATPAEDGQAASVRSVRIG